MLIPPLQMEKFVEIPLLRRMNILDSTILNWIAPDSGYKTTSYPSLYVLQTSLSKADEDEIHQNEEELVEKLTSADDLMEIHHDILQITENIKSDYLSSFTLQFLEPFFSF